MKSKKMTAVLGVAAAAMVALTSVPAWAEAADQQETAATEAADGAAEAKAADFGIDVDGAEVQTVNDTTTVITGAAFKDGTILLTEESGAAHTFENVTAGEWKEITLYEEYGFFYLKYKDESDKEQEFIETAEEKALEQPVTVYATDNVNVRKEAKTDAGSLLVTTVADEGTVSAVVPGWLKVKIGNVEGYASHKYFTEVKEDADSILKVRQENAKKAAEAAAAAAAQSASQSQSGGSGVYEVGRQAYDDCDGSGHGYYEITYSDGSVSYEDY